MPRHTPTPEGLVPPGIFRGCMNRESVAIANMVIFEVFDASYPTVVIWDEDGELHLIIPEDN